MSESRTVSEIFSVKE